MNVHADLSFVSMVMNASIAVQAVMALLALLSLWSWWTIFQKLFQLSSAKRDADRFEDEFWKGGDLAELFQKSSQSRNGGGLEHIFTAGFREYAKHRRQGSSPTLTLDAARRAMRAAYQREVDALEAHLSGLANVAQATLTQVAPGIAEALVATAIGLFAAIPAVVAYNRFTHDVDRLAVRFETFIEEFSNILQRQG